MVPQRWSDLSAAAAAAHVGGPAGGGPRQSPRPSRGDVAIDWPQWLRETERKRRRLTARHAEPSGNGNGSGGAAATGHDGGGAFWLSYFVAATESSFRLDGMTLPGADLSAALARGWGKRAFQSRQQQRVRNHIAILHHIERLLRDGAALKVADAVRWYASVACGLSTTRLDEPSTARLDSTIRQINSPHLRLCPAVQGIARLHRELLADPIVPSFNGILARLLLRYHLGRCGLPPVIFKPDRDTGALADESRLVARMLELIDEAHDAMLRND